MKFSFFQATRSLVVLLGGFLLLSAFPHLACAPVLSSSPRARPPSPGEAAPNGFDPDDPVQLAQAWQAFLASETRPRIGLALGGGGARGMAHIGVLKSLEAAGIPVDVVTGTSIGSFIGALYAAGASPAQIQKIAETTNWSNLVEQKQSRIGLFSTRRLELFIEEDMRSFLREQPTDTGSSAPVRESKMGPAREDRFITFDELKRPFLCTATDLYSGEIVVFESGPVATAVRASCSIPGLFEPIFVGDRLLVDGGVLMNLPVSLCFQKGADVVIAVDVENDSPGNLTGLIDVLGQIIRIQGRALTAPEREKADVILTPHVGDIGMTDLSRTREAIREGTITGHLAASAIKKYLLGFQQRAFVRAALDSEVAAMRRRVEEVPVEQATANTRTDPRSLLSGAEAAVRLGLFDEALNFLRSLPTGFNPARVRFLKTLSLIRLGRAPDSIPIETPEGILARDEVRLLAAAALDQGRPDLFRSLLRAPSPPLPDTALSSNTPTAVLRSRDVP
ncbi:MAG: hypothetical protein D6679_07115 [Candidatus Hydrogenedentota bacterium]|nr:MAG: hypothetical protein D6679_07115 [Candidatus Hydrogenedentota bacterium]